MSPVDDLPAPALAVIGGTGLYELASLQAVTQQTVETPFGPPSAAIVRGTWADRPVAFLPRHGSEHTVLPQQVNYRANVYALKAIGARRVLAVNAVGGLRRAWPPASLVLPDQIIDYTWGRAHTYAGELDEVEWHVDFTEPYCQALRQAIVDAGDEQLAATEAVLGVTQGPRLESAAEIRRLDRDGCDLVGMTGMPEAALARELGLSYASVCIVANLAAGLGDGLITLDEVLDNVSRGVTSLAAVIEGLLTSLDA